MSISELLLNFKLLILETMNILILSFNSFSLLRILPRLISLKVFSTISLSEGKQIIGFCSAKYSYNLLYGIPFFSRCVNINNRSACCCSLITSSLGIRGVSKKNDSYPCINDFNRLSCFGS